MLKTELRSVRMTMSHCSLVTPWSMASRVIPALLTGMSMGPRSFVICAMALFAGRIVADVQLVDGESGLALELLGRGVVARAIRGHAIPLVFSAIETAWPMPRVPPVTTATRARLVSLRFNCWSDGGSKENAGHDWPTPLKCTWSHRSTHRPTPTPPADAGGETLRHRTAAFPALCSCLR